MKLTKLVNVESLHKKTPEVSRSQENPNFFLEPGKSLQGVYRTFMDAPGLRLQHCGFHMFSLIDTTGLFFCC